jgi:hypothetical protein
MVVWKICAIVVRAKRIVKRYAASMDGQWFHIISGASRSNRASLGMVERDCLSTYLGSE